MWNISATLHLIMTLPPFQYGTKLLNKRNRTGDNQPLSKYSAVKSIWFYTFYACAYYSIHGVSPPPYTGHYSIEICSPPLTIGATGNGKTNLKKHFILERFSSVGKCGNYFGRLTAFSCVWLCLRNKDIFQNKISVTKIYQERKKYVTYK